mmetsp:Transcript_25080/g.40498  ORF Transcript_25080/g.40498 Transcript_25080/m.40498 type:complete len:138 (-) Transcript_25080:278-691(-)
MNSPSTLAIGEQGPKINAALPTLLTRWEAAMFLIQRRVFTLLDVVREFLQRPAYLNRHQNQKLELFEYPINGLIHSTQHLHNILSLHWPLATLYFFLMKSREFGINYPVDHLRRDGQFVPSCRKESTIQNFQFLAFY